MTRISGAYTSNVLGTIASHLAGLQGYDVMALELIQNADDAEAEEIVFDVTAKGLLLRNSGHFKYCGDLASETCGFESTSGRKCDFHRITEIAGGGKLKERHTIGRFGIGFVSAYQITDRPQVRSAGVSVTIIPERGRWELEPYDEPQGTSFFLPWADAPESEVRKRLGMSHVTDGHVEQLVDVLQQTLRESLLFLRHIRRAEVRREGTLLAACGLERENADLLVSFSPGGEVEQWHILRTDAQPAAEDLYARYPTLEALERETKVAIGIRADGRPLSGGLLYAFLPTEQPTGLPVHINADFFPEADRKSAIFKGSQHQQAWNEMLIEVAAAELARDPEEMCQVLGVERVWEILGSAYDLHSKPSEHPAIFKRFWEHLKDRCARATIVPTRDGSVRRPEEVTLLRGISFSTDQVQVFLELGGFVASDSLRPYMYAVNQLGSPFLTLGRLVTLVENGLSALKAGESKVDASRLQELYWPLWGILEGLLPDPGTESAEAKEHVRRVKALPVILSEDLYAVTPDMSYVAAPPLVASRVAALLPRLSVAHHGVSGAPKLTKLMAPLSLSAVASHLDGLNDGELHEAISVEPKDLRDFYTLLADLDRAGTSDESVYRLLRRLPIWPSARGLISADGALLPGNFTAPAGVGDLLDTALLSDRVREFLGTKLGIDTQSIGVFVETVVPRLFGVDGPNDPSKYGQLIEELARHPELLNDDRIRTTLGSLPLLPTQDGGWSCPVEMYRRTDALVEVLGEATHLWLDTSRVPRTLSVQTFINNLGLRRTALADHLVDRMVAVAEDDIPTETARRASGEAFYALCERFDTWSGQDFFRRAISRLKETACFPAEEDEEGWHRASALYAPYSAAGFRSQARILDFRNMNRLSRPLLEAVGVAMEPETALVVQHLQYCMERGDKPSDVTYQLLNARASGQDAALVEKLADSACIYVEGRSFVRPRQLYWAPQHLGRFALRIPQNLELFRPLFKALGVKDSPQAPELVGIILDIADEYASSGRELVGPDRAVYDGCWTALCAADAVTDLSDDDVMRLRSIPTVVNVVDRLVFADEVLFRDSEWYSGFFAGELDEALCEPPPDRWPLLQEVGVKRLSGSARVSLEFADDESEADESEIAARISERTELLLRLLHDKTAAARAAVSIALDGLSAASHDVVEIRARVALGNAEVEAPRIRTPAYYDADAKRLKLARPLDDATDANVLKALLHQVLPQATGSEVGKLTLSFEPLLHLAVDLGHRKLTNAGLPEPARDENTADIVDLVSPDVGGIGEQSEAHEGDAGVSTDPAIKPAAPPPDEVEARGDSPAKSTETGVTREQPHRATASQKASQEPARSKGKRRPEHKVQWDRRLVSYVHKDGKHQSDGPVDTEGHQHKLAVEAVAREAVCQYEVAHGRDPEQMPQTNPGYDVISRDRVRGHQRFIEVKGVSGEWNKTGVKLSHLQFSNALDMKDDFWLYVVEFVEDPQHMQIHAIKSPAWQVTDFMFDGNWRDASDDDPVDPFLAFAAGARVEHRDFGRGRVASAERRGSSLVLAIAFDRDVPPQGPRTVTYNKATLSAVTDDDGDASA